MKTKFDLESLVGKRITGIKYSPLGEPELVIEDSVLEINRDGTGSMYLKLDKDDLFPFSYITWDEWRAITDAFPNITINGRELHESSVSAGGGFSVHAKWTEDTGCILRITDVYSFDGKDVKLIDSPVEVHHNEDQDEKQQ